jgi:hypothetical protein
LELCRVFFPYKYETDQNWNDVLTEMLPKFININTDKDYQLALAELAAKTDDSHAFLFFSVNKPSSVWKQKTSGGILLCRRKIGYYKDS